MNRSARVFLEKLLATPSPSGEESAIQDQCARRLEKSIPKIRRDVHGNQYYPLTGFRARRVMLSAHVDEIGLMVQSIDGQGFLKIVPIGGVDSSTLPGQRVRGARVSGVIGTQATLFRPEAESKQNATIDKLWVDIGARDKKDAESLIGIGETLTLDTPLTWLRNDRIAARGLDNRIGAFILTETLLRLARRNLKVDIIGVTTVQEEVGLRGARTSGYQTAPDIAINLDVNFATDHPRGDGERWGETSLSGGPILARGAGVNPRLLAEFQTVAAKADIPVQVRAEPTADGTDAGALQLARGGVAVMDMGIPNRYMHTAVEMVCLHDVEHCIELLTQWVIQCPAEGDYIIP